jgi:acyl carrier protein
VTRCDQNLDLMEVVLDRIHSINSRIDARSLDPARSLLEQGMDSLDLISLFTALARDTGKEFPPEKLPELLTVEKLVAFLSFA